MGPGIIIPVLVIVILVPLGLVWARRQFKDTPHDDEPPAPSGLLTSNVLRRLPTPPWRVVYEISPSRLGGVEHVLIGPGGIFAVVTSMDPMPGVPPSDTVPEAHAIAAAAILRGTLDDALRRCAMASDQSLSIHWGPSDGRVPISVDVMPGAIAVDGRRIEDWAAATQARPDGSSLSPAQVDLAWQTVVTAIGRPDPLG